MPYNNNPIAPPQEFTGTVSLPLARVKKIIAADEDIGNCSNNAAFVIAVATEMFVQYLVEQTHHVAKSERKPRRTIQYRDVANAIARIDNLEFLSDVVPRTMTYGQYLEHEERKRLEKAEARQGASGPSNAAPPAGPHHQRSLSHDRPGTSHTEPIGAEEMDLDRGPVVMVSPINGPPELPVRNGHAGPSNGVSQWRE